MTNADMIDLMTIMKSSFNARCFALWYSGARLGSTLKAHCLEYFTPDSGALRAMDQLSEGAGSDGILTIKSVYRRALRSSYKTFAQYSEEQCQAIYQDWLRHTAEG